MKNSRIEIDNLLKYTLNSTEAPDPGLVEKVKKQVIKEDSSMKKSLAGHSFRVAAIALTAIILISTTAFAAWYILSPSEVADELQSPALAQAFRSEEAILINETQSQNGYDISFLGIVSGKELSEFNGTLDTERSYAVVAIARQEGAMPATVDSDYDSTPFFVSPLIHGQEPWVYNIASMNGAYESCVVEGVMYRLIECDSLEMFADRGLSLIVSSTDFYDTEAYSYDVSTGLVTPNSDYDGVNLVFDLPLETANADYDKAQQYLDTLWNEEETDDAEDEPVSGDGNQS